MILNTIPNTFYKQLGELTEMKIMTSGVLFKGVKEKGVKEAADMLFGSPLRLSNNIKEGVLYPGGYGFSYSSMGYKGCSRYFSFSSTMP